MRYWRRAYQPALPRRPIEYLECCPLTWCPWIFCEAVDVEVINFARERDDLSLGQWQGASSHCFEQLLDVRGCKSVSNFGVGIPNENLTCLPTDAVTVRAVADFIAGKSRSITLPLARPRRSAGTRFLN